MVAVHMHLWRFRDSKVVQSSLQINLFPHTSKLVSVFFFCGEFCFRFLQIYFSVLGFCQFGSPLLSSELCVFCVDLESFEYTPISVEGTILEICEFWAFSQFVFLQYGGLNQVLGGLRLPVTCYKHVTDGFLQVVCILIGLEIWDFLGSRIDVLWLDLAPCHGHVIHVSNQQSSINPLLFCKFCNQYVPFAQTFNVHQCLQFCQAFPGLKSYASLID